MDFFPELGEIEQLLLTEPETAEDVYLRNLFWEELEKALAELPETLREVFVKTELMGLSFKRLSQETGVPVNTLLSRKHKAVQTLRIKLLDLYGMIVSGN
jgi:RNA polymerase sigma factor (sigma-70 family)